MLGTFRQDLLVIQSVDDLLTEVSMLQISLHLPAMSIVEFRGDYMRIVGDSLNLAEFWLVFTDLRWISLACMALSPSIATRGIEGARFLPAVGDLCLCLTCQLLTERNEKAG